MFYLGTHQVHWITKTDVPLFLSARRLRDQKRWPRALGRWALDSGGFSELTLHGGWRTPPEAYAAEARYWMDALGGLDFAATQDWMCEPHVLEKTGKTVWEHQNRSTRSYLRLTELDPGVPWIPVLQGYSEAEYLAHVELYEACGVDLRALPRVGVGSVCRRQATAEIESLFRTLHGLGLRNLHGFGVKTQGLPRVGKYLASSDSMAWSLDARRKAPIPGHTHKNCANCLEWALRWRSKVLERAEMVV